MDFSVALQSSALIYKSSLKFFLGQDPYETQSNKQTMTSTTFSLTQLILLTVSLLYISTAVSARPSPQLYEEAALWADDAVREAEQDRLAVSRVGMTEWSDEVTTSW